MLDKTPFWRLFTPKPSNTNKPKPVQETLASKQNVESTRKKIGEWPDAECSSFEQEEQIAVKRNILIRRGTSAWCNCAKTRQVRILIKRETSGIGKHIGRKELCRRLNNIAALVDNRLSPL
jgi:hypothetical protein